MTDNALILVAEDEPQIADVLIAYLVREGYRTVHAADGRVALDHHRLLRPDLILLDVKLPKLDGLEVLAEVRRRGTTPVIMVTALAEDLDKLLGLRAGADDYVVKPFNTLEVMARVRSVLRRAGTAGPAPVLRVGRLDIDLEGHFASIAGRVIDLTPTEFRLLAHMARQPRRAFNRAELVDACLPEGEALARTVDSHASNLRRKISEAGGGMMVEAVRGVGYRLEVMT